MRLSNSVINKAIAHLFPFILELVHFILQSELLLAEEADVELLGGVSSREVPPHVDIVVPHYSRHDV